MHVNFELHDLRPEAVAGKFKTGRAERMSLYTSTAEAFQLLELGRIPTEWVTRLWEQNFCESASLPLEVRETYVRRPMVLNVGHSLVLNALNLATGSKIAKLI